MGLRRVGILVVVLALLLGVVGCTSSSDKDTQKQAGYTVDPGLFEMTVGWAAESGDRRSEKFENVVFAGDIVDDWAQEVIREIGAYQKSNPEVEYADIDETSVLVEYDLIILADGLLQLLGGKTAAEYAGMLEMLVYQLLDDADENAVILVTGIPYISADVLGTVPAERITEYNAAIRAVAMGANVLYANVYRAQSQTEWSRSEDGMSFSSIGNILVAGEVLQRLIRACSCLAVDGVNEPARSALRINAPTEAALQAFRDAASAEQMQDVLEDTHFGVDLDLYRSLTTDGRTAVCEELLKCDRSIASNYMIADILINNITTKTIGDREALDWAEVPFKTYVSVGDSITQGCMAVNERTDSWVAQLGELISAAQGEDVTQINRGIGGTKMSTAHQHYPAAKDTVQQYIVPLNPDLITIAYGINDFHAGTTLDTFIKDYRVYLQELVDFCPNAVVIVCGLCCKGNDQDGMQVRQWNNAIREMVEEFGLIYCETYDDMYGVNWLLADGLHPNNAGYRLMASTVFRTLNENVNLSR